MATYLIQDTTSKAIKKSLIKWGEFPIDNSSVRGTVNIKNYRQYQFRNEVDIEFNGEICARHSSLAVLTWFKSDIYNQKSTSKIKVNKLIKRAIFKEVKDQAAYFGINLRYVEEIKKINWI